MRYMLCGGIADASVVALKRAVVAFTAAAQRLVETIKRERERERERGVNSRS